MNEENRRPTEASNAQPAPDSNENHCQSASDSQGSTEQQNTQATSSNERATDDAPNTYVNFDPQTGMPLGSQPGNANPQPQQAPKKNSDRGCLIALSIAALLAFFLGLGSCTLAINTVDWAENEGMLDDLSALGDIDDADDLADLIGSMDSEDDTSMNNASLRSLIGMSASGDQFTKDDLNKIQKTYFANAAAQGKNKPQGVYFVGNDIKAGDYWIGGNDESMSYFFVLQKNGRGYDCTLVNKFYGHNLATVSQGEVLIVVNGSEGFCPLSDISEKFSDPYTNGVFRVGNDIPAGTYYLKAGKDTSNYSAYYVMDNLSYEGDYIVEQKQETDRDKFSTYQVTLKDGQFLELFNATATKGTRG